MVYRWQAIVQENADSLNQSGEQNIQPHIFENGDTRRHLLARSWCYLEFKSEKPGFICRFAALFVIL